MVLYIIKAFCFFRRRDSLSQVRVERRWFELASKGDLVITPGVLTFRRFYVEGFLYPGFLTFRGYYVKGFLRSGVLTPSGSYVQGFLRSAVLMFRGFYVH